MYGTDGYFIAQYPNGNENNTLQPAYADIQLVPGKGYEVGAEQYQAKFDDVTKTGNGDVADLVCGDYWANSGPTGTLDDLKLPRKLLPFDLALSLIPHLMDLQVYYGNPPDPLKLQGLII